MIAKIIQHDLERTYTVDVRKIGDSQVLEVKQCGDRLATAKVSVADDGVTIATMAREIAPRRPFDDVVRVSKNDPTLLDTINQRLDNHFRQGARRIVPR